MKHIVILIFLVLSQQIITGQEKKIKQIETSEYPITLENKKWVKDQLWSYGIKKYNIDGTEKKENGIILLNNKNTKKVDENGNLLEKSYFNSNGSLRTKYTYKYDSSNNKIEVNEFDQNGTLIFQDKNVYNSNNFLIEKLQFEKDTVLYYKSIFAYDTLGNLIKKIETGYEGEFKQWELYEYRKGDLLIEKQNLDSDSNLISRIIYSYSDHGLILSETNFEFDTQTDKIEYKYEFDKHGNWIEKTKYFNEKPQLIIERKIEYY